MPERNPIDELWTVQQLADYLGVTTHTVYGWNKSARKVGPPPIRLARGFVRYRRSEVMRWLDDQQPRPPKPGSARAGKTRKSA